MFRRLRDSTVTPLVALAIVSVLSLGARALLLDEPCQSPCTRAGDHTLIFDEAYYVNAARVIAGIRPPAGAHYADAPLGTDPNAEHPQGAKLIMAAAIEIFGDGPFAWRIGSLIFGSIAILGMYALARSAGASRWTGVGASALMASDNLLLVHGRIGTLDIYAAAMMIWALALYLRGRPVLAGVALAIGSAFKLVAPYLLAVLVLLELGRLLVKARNPAAPDQWRPRPALWRLLVCAFTGAGLFMGILAVMDQIATPYNDAAAQLVTGGPFDHFAHMVAYAGQQVSPNGPQGIASYPWAWLVDLKPIVYLRINPSLPGHGLDAIHPVAKFLGMVSPPILLMAMLGMIFALVRLIRRPSLVHGLEAAGLEPAGLEAAGPEVSAGSPTTARAVADLQVPLVALCWFLGTWAPFALLSLIDQRTSYLYYMVIVMPGLYLGATWLTTRLWRPRRWWSWTLAGLWMMTVLVALVLMYPFVPVF